MQHPPEVAQLLRQQTMNPGSQRAQRQIRTPFADVKDEKKRQAMIANRQKAGRKSQRKRRRRGKSKGALTRLYNVYRRANLLTHTNAIALKKKLDAMG